MAFSQKVRNEVAVRSVGALSVLLIIGAGIFTGSRTDEFWVVSAVIIVFAAVGAILMRVANVHWNPQYKHYRGRPIGSTTR